MKSALVLMPDRKEYVQNNIMPYISQDTVLVERPDLGLSDAHELAWRTVSGSNYGVVLHDDIKLCNDFWSKLTGRVEDGLDHNYHFMTFYSPRKTARIDMEKGKTWSRLSASSFLCEECVVMEGGFLDEYNKWLINNSLGNRVWHDYQLQQFLKYKKEPVWICIPNLVDHATDILKSLIGHSPKCWGKPRVSSTWRIDAE